MRGRTFREATMQKVNYLNVGCGNKFHQAWTNVDMASSSPHVDVHNLLHGFPYRDNQFDVVYHSQVLEHVPKEKAAGFLRECLRVLKPGGVLRVVVPDLENIATEYLRQLRENIERPSEVAAANYDWILLEMYDQTVRNRPEGQMGDFLKQPRLANEHYIVERIGHVGRSIIARGQQQAQERAGAPLRGWFDRLRRITPRRLVSYLRIRVRDKLGGEALRIGMFRLGGEVHMWMYDRFSLARLMREAGFEQVRQVDAHTSAIPGWPAYELDVKDGAVFDPTSLFMEAQKPGA
jgi:predicted SAM-dependent methyltransferase